MQAFTRSPRHAEVLDGIAGARAAGFERLKLNTVVIRGFNDDELTDLIEFARAQEAEVRFIEYMDVGGATHWSREQVVGQREMLEVLARRYGPIEPVPPPPPPPPGPRPGPPPARVCGRRGPPPAAAPLGHGPVPAPRARARDTPRAPAVHVASAAPGGGPLAPAGGRAG